MNDRIRPVAERLHMLLPLLVRMMGLEPIRSCEHEHLKLACLPIPAHARTVVCMVNPRFILF